MLAVFSGISANALTWGDAGSYNISWYTTDENLHVSTPEEIAGIAYLVNNNFTKFSNQTVHIDADINMNGKIWIPINDFMGSINGHGHTISGISIGDSDNAAGFIGYMKGGVISSLNLEARVSTKKTRSAILVYSASECSFYDLSIKGNISYVNQTISASTEWNTEIYNGGVVGLASDCTFVDVKSSFTQSLVFGGASGNSVYGYIKVYAGGIVAYGEKKNTYLRCESVSSFDNTIYGYKASSYYTQKGSTTVRCAGIVGYESSSTSTMTSCLSRITNNEGSHLTGTYDHVEFQTLSFGCFNGKISNSVSIVDSYSIKGHDYSWVSTGYHTHLLLSDSGKNNKSSIVGGCYVNNDISISTSKTSGNDVKVYSSRSFSKSQMNSQMFVDELNIYSMLNMGGVQNWEIKNGQLSLKHDNYDNSGVNEVEVDDNTDNENEVYYRLDGTIAIKPLSAGIYIRRSGSKTSKILIR